MSHIARAFTTRRVKMSIELAQEARERAAMQRSNTTKATTSSSVRGSQDQTAVSRPKISGPLELIHTTNMLSYNAPDLPRPSTSSEASTKSDTESETSTPTSDISSPPTSPDVAPEEMDRCISPEPNHLSCYFQPPVKATVKSAPVTMAQAPAIPTRAPSHTKKASFEAVGRQRSASVLSKESGRSVSTKASFSFSRSSSGSTTASSVASPIQSHPYHHQHKMSSTTTITSAPPPVPRALEKKAELPESHPFGQELAQVTEIAEEFGRQLDAIDEEEQELASRGLCKLTADVYLRDIEVLLSSFFNDREPTRARVPVATAVWI